MQTVGLALPELHHLWVQDVATPVLWLWHLLFLVELFQFLILLSQILPIGDYRTLVADHSPNLAALGAGVEVTLSLLFRQLLHRALHTDLAVEGLPVEDKGGKGIGVQLSSLPTLEVSEEAEAILAKALQQYHAGRRFSISGAGSQTHGIGFPYVRTLNSLLKPGSKLLHGVQGGQLSLLKRLSVPAVALPHRAQVHDDTATAQVVEVAGPPGRSPKRHGDASQPARHEAASHVTRRRPALGSVGFGTNFSAREFTRGTEEFARRQALLTGPESSEPMGAQGRRRETGAERPLVGAVRERGQ